MAPQANPGAEQIRELFRWPPCISAVSAENQPVSHGEVLGCSLSRREMLCCSGRSQTLIRLAPSAVLCGRPFRELCGQDTLFTQQTHACGHWPGSNTETCFYLVDRFELPCPAAARHQTSQPFATPFPCMMVDRVFQMNRIREWLAGNLLLQKEYDFWIVAHYARQAQPLLLVCGRPAQAGVRYRGQRLSTDFHGRGLSVDILRLGAFCRRGRVGLGFQSHFDRRCEFLSGQPPTSSSTTRLFALPPSC